MAKLLCYVVNTYLFLSMNNCTTFATTREASILNKQSFLDDGYGYTYANLLGTDPTRIS